MALHSKSQVICWPITSGIKSGWWQVEVRILSGDLLDAARVNLGVLGVVVEATLNLEEAFKVKAEVKGYNDDTGLEDIILDVARSNYSANIAWFRVRPLYDHSVQSSTYRYRWTSL